jgi:hypothetical protein
MFLILKDIRFCFQLFSSFRPVRLNLTLFSHRSLRKYLLDQYQPSFQLSLSNMQFSTMYLSLVLATAVVAKGERGNSTMKAVTDKSLCREMRSLNKLVKLASNETRLADKMHNNATKIASIQAKASEASTKLTKMEANTTLTMTCSVMAAAEKTEVPLKILSDVTMLTISSGRLC